MRRRGIPDWKADGSRLSPGLQGKSDLCVVLLSHEERVAFCQNGQFAYVVDGVT